MMQRIPDHGKPKALRKEEILGKEIKKWRMRKKK